MALDELVRSYASVCFNVVDVLGVVCEQLPFALKQLNEGMCRREPFCVRNDILRNRIEDCRIITEGVNIKHVLWVIQAEMLEARIQSILRRAEIRNT